MSQNSNNSEWMALCCWGGAKTCPALSQLVTKGSVHSQNRSVPFTELECSNSMILLLLDNHTQLQRPLAEKKKKQSRAITNPKKGTKKGKQNKMKIHNTQCQITNPLRYNNISKWEEFQNNSCSLSGHWKNYDLFLKRLKRGNPAPLMPLGTPSQRGSAFVRGQQSCHGDRRAPTKRRGHRYKPGTRRQNGNLAKRRGVRTLTGPRLKKVPRLNLNTTQRAGPPHLRKQLVPPKLLTFV